MAELGIVTQVGKYISRGQPRPPSIGTLRSWDSPIYAEIVRPSMIFDGNKCWMGACVYEGSRGGSHSRVPRQQGRPQRPQKCWDLLYMRTHSTRNSDQILHGEHTRRGGFLHGRQRTVTRGLFAVANLFVQR